MNAMSMDEHFYRCHFPLLRITLMFSLVLTGLSLSQAGSLSVGEQGYDGYSINSSNFIFANLRLKDNAGNFITDRTLEDFILTESVLTLPDGELIDGPAVVNIPDCYDGHFHVESTGDSKLDIVVLLDDTGTMDPDVSHIRSELNAFVDRLIEGHHDFRFAMAEFSETPNLDKELPLIGVGDEGDIRQAINTWGAAGEWWSPTNAYDALLWTDYLGFRDDARKIIIIITDIIPQTPYGTFWYEPGANSADTVSAVAEYLSRHPGMEVYVAFDSDREHPDMHIYVDKDINPMASDAMSGWAALESRGLITALRPSPAEKPWPFDQSLIPIDPVPMEDSFYCLVWENSVDFDWNYDREKGYYKVTIETEDPDNASQTLALDVLYPIEQVHPDIVVQVADEEGTIQDGEYWGYLHRMMGSHRIQTHWQTSSRDGGVMTFANVEPGTYLMSIYDSGIHGFYFNSMNASWFQVVTQTENGLELSARVRTGMHDAAMSRALGLLRELHDWQVPGEPFDLVCDQAESWLLSLEADGISWEDMSRIRRFYLALSCYANLSEYARMEIDQSQAIFAQMVEDIAELVRQVQDLEDTTDQAWRQALDILLDIVYAILSRGQITAEKQVVEQGLNQLIQYAARQLVPEVKDAIIEKLPLGDWQGLIKAIIQHLIDREYEDWSDVIEAARQVAIRQAVNQVSDRLSDGFADQICEGIGAGDQYKEILAPLVKRLIKSFCEANTAAGDDGFGQIAGEMEKFASDLVTQLGQQYVEDYRLEVGVKIDGLFSEAMGNVPDGLPGTIVQFLLQMVHDLAGEAVATVNVQTGKCSLNKGRITDILVYNAFYFAVLQHFYVDETRNALELTLARAKAWTPLSTQRWESDGTGLERELNNASWDARNVIRYLQDDAWDAMEVQEDIGNWIAALKLLGSILEPLGIGLDFFAKLYPTLQDTADNVKDFATVVNGLQITSQAIELGLRMDCLDDFGNQPRKIYPAVYPGFRSTVGTVTVEATTLEATEGIPDNAIVFTVRLAQISPIPTVINYSMGGMAVNGIDYDPLPGSVFVPKGMSRAQVIVRPIADRRVETSEAVTLTLMEGDYDIALPFVAAATIQDEDIPGVTIQATQPIGKESAIAFDGVSFLPGSSLVFTFTRSGDTGQALDVPFSLWGSATPGDDYAAVDELITIPAGEVSANLEIIPTADNNNWEGSETVTLALEPGDYALGSPVEASGIICEGDANLVWVEATDPVAVEGDPSKPAVFTVTRRSVTTGTLTVNVRMEGDASNSYDYERIYSSVTIPADQASVTVAALPRGDDGYVEAVESIIMMLEPLDDPPDNEQDDYVIAEPSSATAWLYDAAATQVSIDALVPLVTEDGTMTGGFVVSRSGGPDRELTVTYDVGGSAHAGADYDTLPGTLTFAAGAVAMQIPLSVLQDEEDEGSEGVSVQLSAGSNYGVGKSDQAMIVIIDDETPANQFWVDPTAIESGMGTFDMPYQSLGLALQHAGLCAGPDNPVKVYLPGAAADTVMNVTPLYQFEESVTLPSHVSLIGPGEEMVVLKGSDPSVPVLTAMDGSVVSGLTLRPADLVGPGRMVLLAAEDAGVTVRNCVLDGQGQSQCIGALIQGQGTAQTLFERCTFHDAWVGAWCEGSAPMFRLNVFEDLSGYGVYSLPTAASPLATPILGGLAGSEVLGFNRFNDIEGEMVKNMGQMQILAGWNDWSVYSFTQINERCLGMVNIGFLLGESMEDALCVLCINGRSGLQVYPGPQASLKVDGGSYTAEFDTMGQVYRIESLPPGDHFFTMTAPGYETLETVRNVQYGTQELILLTLTPENAADLWWIME